MFEQNRTGAGHPRHICMLFRLKVLPPSLVHLTNHTCISVTTNIGWPILAAREADLNAANCLASACWRSIEACDYDMGPAPCLKVEEVGGDKMGFHIEDSMDI